MSATNPIFNSADFVEESGGGLSETTANSLYLRKTIDDSTANQLTVNAILTPSINSGTEYGNMALGCAQTGGWLNIANRPDGGGYLVMASGSDSGTGVILACGKNYTGGVLICGGEGGGGVVRIGSHASQSKPIQIGDAGTADLYVGGKVSIGSSTMPTVVNGSLTAAEGLNMGTSQIALGSPAVPRAEGNLGYVFLYNSFATSVTFSATTVGRLFWSQANWPIGVWIANITLQCSPTSTTSNIALSFGDASAAKNYGYVLKPLATTQQTTICMNTVISLTNATTTLYVSGTATFSAAVPSLLGANSSIVLTRIA